MLVQGRRSEAGSVARVSASALERIVLDALAAVSVAPMSDHERVEQNVGRVVIGTGTVAIHLIRAAETAGAANPILISWSPQPTRRKREVIGPAGTGSTARPIRAAARSKLLHGIAKGRSWLDEIMTGTVPDIETIAQRESISERAARMTLSLAFVAPDMVQAAVDGILPRGFGISRLTDLPLSWAEQRQKLGLPARS